MLSRDEFLEKYRHVLRSICLDGFIRRPDEPDENKWKRIALQADKVDAILNKIFDELAKPPAKEGSKQSERRESENGNADRGRGTPGLGQDQQDHGRAAR